MGDLIRMRGRNAADAELRRGDISAQMWANLGNQISGAITGYAREREEAPMRAMAAERQRREFDAEDRLSRQDSAFVALLEQQPNPDPREVMAIYGPQRGMQIAQGLTAFAELQAGKVRDARDTAGRLAVGMKSLSPQLQQQMWPAVRDAAVRGGLGDAETIPEQFTPGFLDGVIGWATGQAPVAPSLIQRDPTKDLAHPITGEVVSRGTPDETVASNPTEASLAAAAANGDPRAREALRLLRAQRAPYAPQGVAGGTVDAGTRALAEMTARTGQLPEGTPTQRGSVMRNMATDPALLAQYEAKRMEPIRARATEVLSALDDLVTKDGELTPGARALFGELTPVWSRGYGVKADTVAANASLQQLIGQEVVELIREMKGQSQTGATGFGALNLRELDIILAAATKLTRRLPEEDAREQLNTLREKFSLIVQPGEGEGGNALDPLLDELLRER